MIALIQRVKHASVCVNHHTIAEIKHGLLILLGIEKTDDQTKADRLLEKVLSYRIFADSNDKMNLNVQQANGSILVVSQFTLAADTHKGLRPSFSNAASPQQAEKLYDYFSLQCQARINTSTGIFAANMQVNLTNDGPVTFWLQI